MHFYLRCSITPFTLFVLSFICLTKSKILVFPVKTNQKRKKKEKTQSSGYLLDSQWNRMIEDVTAKI